jgi:hypothetical protein
MMSQSKKESNSKQTQPAGEEEKTKLTKEQFAKKAETNFFSESTRNANSK